MASLRYAVAFIFMIGLPPGLLFWFLIHPFAAFWRTLGPGWTYGLVGALLSVLSVGLALGRTSLLATEYGTHAICLGLAAVCVTGACGIAFQRRKYLTLRIMVGLPELSAQSEQSPLLQKGIYAQIRHPRYVEVFLAVLGAAFFANYLLLYVWVALSLPVLYVIVVLEERELHQRFGTAYATYCKRVPRFFPRWDS